MITKIVTPFLVHNARLNWLVVDTSAASLTPVTGCDHVFEFITVLLQIEQVVPALWSLDRVDQVRLDCWFCLYVLAASG